MPERPDYFPPCAIGEQCSTAAAFYDHREETGIRDNTLFFKQRCTTVGRTLLDQGFYEELEDCESCPSRLMKQLIPDARQEIPHA